MRLAFGLGLAMLLTSPVKVTAGFFRNHLYVVLGLAFLAFLVVFGSVAGGVALGAALLSYVGSVCYLYQSIRSGRVVLGLVSLSTLVGVLLGTPQLVDSVSLSPLALVLWLSDGPTSGLLLGVTLGAMLLGHWYLNTPSMQMAPLRRLLALMVAALFLRMLVCGIGLGATCMAGPIPAPWFVVLRWVTGLAAPLVMAWMVERTLRIPNTQSATGILYVAAVTVFTGELMSQLLSVTTTYPL
ncbi:MAG: hypothetical protein P8M53_08485 [Pirellulales bacterium]|nr:hypothetical protein [Pirellulales bacterium]